MTYAEALWDHVTFDPDELPFRAGDVVEVTHMEDKDWWWGIIGPSQGWFPAAFVRVRESFVTFLVIHSCFELGKQPWDRVELHVLCCTGKRESRNM